MIISKLKFKQTKVGFTQPQFWGQIKTGAGFTLIETLVAIAILNLSIAAAFTAAQSGLSASIFSRDQIVASFLAQEGAEVVRNIRDGNAIAGLGWTTGLGSCLGGNYCYVDGINLTASGCGATLESCPVLRLDSTAGLYGYNAAWAATNFRRAVTIQQLNINEIAVIVNMSWSKGNLTRQFNIRTNLLNWQ